MWPRQAVCFGMSLTVAKCPGCVSPCYAIDGDKRCHAVVFNDYLSQPVANPSQLKVLVSATKIGETRAASMGRHTLALH